MSIYSRWNAACVDCMVKGDLVKVLLIKVSCHGNSISVGSPLIVTSGHYQSIKLD